MTSESDGRGHRLRLVCDLSGITYALSYHTPTSTHLPLAQFRIYLGLLTSMPVYRRPKAKERRLDHPDVGYVNEPSEDEADHDMPRARHTINLSIVQDTLEQTAQPGKQLEPDNFEESSEQKQLFCAFTDDIEKGIMIFFGAYMRDSNLIWWANFTHPILRFSVLIEFRSEPNLFIAPTVLHFFLRFMLRNDVFYDSPSHTDNLIRAISVAELAIKELPLTAQIGQALPGKFDLACREHWGRRGNRSVHISAVDPVVDWARNEDSSGAPDVDAGVPPTSATSDDTEGNFQTWSSWTDVSVPSLCDILGQTQFTHEYAPWIVEHSTRRIHSVIPPMHQDQHDVAELGSEGVGALERRFARVILHPWVLSENEATEEFQAPVVVPVPCTCGPSDRDLNLPAPASTQEHAHTHGHGQGKEHDPYRDAVTLLVEPSHVPLLSVGMGLSGTWVGLGCASLAVRDEGERGTITDGGDYWYIEDLMSVFPSFYAESEGILGRVVQGAGDADDDVVD